MRRAVRRLTWILLSLALMTVLCFGMLAELLSRPGTGPELPRFFNPEPRNVRDLAHAAVDRLQRGDDRAAAAELSRLGGAALPFVLPNLDRLDPATQQRLALALTPVALRMGAAQPEELASGAAAVGFWSRFWQDRSVDFRETVVRRLVARLGERSLALRREDVVALDTYALRALIEALGRVQTKDDVMRVRRLTTVLAHVGGNPWTIERTASVEEARRVARQWQRWWEEHGSDYSPLDGPNRLAAMVKDTAYGRWLASTVRGELGRTSDGRTGLELLRATALGSALRFAAVLSLGTLLGALAAGRVPRLGNRWATALEGSAIAFAGLPALVLLTPLGPGAGTGAALTATLVLALWHAAHVVAHAPRSDAGLARQLVPALGLVAPRAPLLAGLVLALECLLGLKGLGAELRRALVAQDLHAAMAVSLGCALLAALGILASDALQAVTVGEEPQRD